VVTISFGLRNVADPQAALSEMHRVTKPGGRLVICEFSHLPVRALDVTYQRYLASVLPAVAGRLSPNPGAYAYLAESIRDWPAQEELAGLIRAAGWSSVRWRDLTWGVVAVHVGRKAAKHGAGVRGGARDHQLRARLSASVLVKEFTRLAGRVSERAVPPG